MPNIITRLLGTRAPTAPNLETEIAAQHDLIETARAKIEAAKVARKAAIDDFDAEGHRVADESIAEANREIERRENAVAKLQAAHAERVDLDRREAFRSADADLAADGLALEARIAKEYPGAAKTIAKIIVDVEAFRDRHREMRERGRKIGETSSARDPEDSRGATETTVVGVRSRPSSLDATVGDLPALHVGDVAFRVAPEPPRPAHAGKRA